MRVMILIWRTHSSRDMIPNNEHARSLYHLLFVAGLKRTWWRENSSHIKRICGIDQLTWHRLARQYLRLRKDFVVSYGQLAVLHALVSWRRGRTRCEHLPGGFSMKLAACIRNNRRDVSKRLSWSGSLLYDTPINRNTL